MHAIKTLFFSLSLLLSAAAFVNTSAQIFTTDQTLWLRPEGLTRTQSGRVDSWLDQSSNQAVFNDGGFGNSPFVQDNGPGGHSYLRYDQPQHALMTSSTFSIDSLISPQASTAFFVLRVSGQASPLYWSDGNAGPFSVAMAEKTSPESISRIYFLHGQGDDIQANAPGFFDSWNVVTMVRSGNSGSIRVNGTDQTLIDSAFGAGVTPGSDPMTGFITMGGPEGNAVDTDRMDLAELVLYRSALSPADINQIEQTLLTKYAIIPEPSSYALCGLALGAFVLARRFRR